jgi:hypothetical protein
VHTDHEALLGFKEAKNINRHLAQYVLEMEDYNIALKHHPGTQNKTADALSCHPDYDTGTGDNQGIIVLPAHMFIDAIEDHPPPDFFPQ